MEGVRKDYESINDVLHSPSIMAIIVGIVMIIISLIGLIGALKEHLLLLRIVSILSETWVLLRLYNSIHNPVCGYFGVLLISYACDFIENYTFLKWNLNAIAVNFCFVFSSLE